MSTTPRKSAKMTAAKGSRGVTLNGFPTRRMRVKELTPAEWNPRTMSDHELDKLRKSVQAFGLVEPIIWNEQTNRVVGGHQRLKVLLADNVIETDVIVVDLDENKEKQLNIALNKIHGDWDEDMLRELLDGLRLDDCDLSLTGFEDFEIDEMFEQHETEEKPELTEPQAQHLNEAWQAWANDALKLIEVLEPHKVVSVNATPTIARIHFLRSLYLGERYPRWCSHAFHPEQLHVAGEQHSMIHALRELVTDIKYAERFRWALKETPSIDVILKQSAPISACRMAPDFPAMLARDLINEFCPAKGSVLDPCHGWGGRLVGFLLSHASQYRGFDPCESTHNGTKAIFEDYSQYTPGKRAKFYCECFEDSKLRPASNDFALTSPPYYDVEKYDGAQSSHRRYKSFESWCNGFYVPLLKLTARALKKGGVFVLQIGNQKYPLETTARDHAEACGLEYLETRPTGMVNNLQETPEDQGEVAVIFRKK